MKEGMEGSKKNPWAFGDEAERRMKMEEGKSDADLMKSMDDRLTQMTEDAQNAFYEELQTSPVKKEQSFEADGYGILKIDETDTLPSLWQCAEPTGDNGRLEKGMEPGYTGEDLMRAAMQLQKKFPDIQFEFKDERPKKFSFTAVLR